MIANNIHSGGVGNVEAASEPPGEGAVNCSVNANLL